MKSCISTSYFGWNSVTAVWINLQHPGGSISLLYHNIFLHDGPYVLTAPSMVSSLESLFGMWHYLKYILDPCFKSWRGETVWVKWRCQTGIRSGREICSEVLVILHWGRASEMNSSSFCSFVMCSTADSNTYLVKFAEIVCFSGRHYSFASVFGIC